MKNNRFETGSASVELVLLTPVLMILVLLVVLAGRSGEVLLQVKHAADQGARAASISAVSKQTVEAERSHCHGSVVQQPPYQR
jgi:Flp pilus assembly protein TadG